jgi:membrane associated rhomboid family serine protease
MQEEQLHKAAFEEEKNTRQKEEPSVRRKSDIELESKRTRRIFLHSLFFPGLFILLLWLIKLVEVGMDISFSHWGVYPRSVEGLPGIFAYPLIHGDFIHLINNSVPLLALGVALFYFYRGLSYKVFFLIWFISGLCLWLSGRPSYHIGASGLVYGLAAFLFFSGIIRQYPRLIAISLAVVFLYGYMVWGIFPMKVNISWEGHLWGALAGSILSLVFRKEGPQKPVIVWEEEDKEEEA